MSKVIQDAIKNTLESDGQLATWGMDQGFGRNITIEAGAKALPSTERPRVLIGYAGKEYGDQLLNGQQPFKFENYVLVYSIEDSDPETQESNLDSLETHLERILNDDFTLGQQAGVIQTLLTGSEDLTDNEDDEIQRFTGGFPTRVMTLQVEIEP